MLQMHLNHVKDGTTFFGCWSGIDVAGIVGVERAKGTSPRVTYVMPSIVPDAIRPMPTCLIFTIIDIY